MRSLDYWDIGFPVDGSPIDVSDGLTLPWINGDLNSKLLQQTPVSENASELMMAAMGT